MTPDRLGGPYVPSHMSLSATEEKDVKTEAEVEGMQAATRSRLLPGTARGQELAPPQPQEGAQPDHTSMSAPRDCCRTLASGLQECTFLSF